ncbi:MAG: division/cell wall cluster transcriptional repressor MraZ [Candidatus Moranbacteria bacterium]|nr:division/cell wall cluster transcriptional repressor MraZ [Candidatus Moranbacteria bacterium]
MFIGEHSHTLDSKNRLAIPAKFRDQLGKKAVITRGLDESLQLYPTKSWEEIAQKLGNMSIGEGGARSFVRLMLSGASEVSLDRLGRILVPQYLKDYAKLKKDTIVNGLFNRIEIWEKTNWNKYKAKAEKDSTKVAEKLGELGIF